jgi:hypothetical protein
MIAESVEAKTEYLTTQSLILSKDALQRPKVRAICTGRQAWAVSVKPVKMPQTPISARPPLESALLSP